MRLAGNDKGVRYIIGTAVFPFTARAFGKLLQLFLAFVYSVPFLVGFSVIPRKMLKKICKSLDYFGYCGYNGKSTLYIARFLHLCQRFAKRAKSMAKLSLLKLNNMYTSCSSNVACWA